MKKRKKTDRGRGRGKVYVAKEQDKAYGNLNQRKILVYIFRSLGTTEGVGNNGFTWKREKRGISYCASENCLGG